MLNTLKIARDLEKAGVSREQAEAHAEVLNEALQGSVATKADVADLRAEIAGLRGEIRAMPATITNRMIGLMAVQVAFFAAILLAALQLWPRG